MKAKYINPFTDFEFKKTIPEMFKEEVFIKAFEKAEIAKYSQEELHDYEQRLKVFRDLKATIDTAFDEGKIQVARNLKELGIDIDIISKSTGLTKEQIEKL